MLKREATIVLCHDDYRRLSSLVASCHQASVDQLEEELGKAAVVEPHEAPDGLVRMNSRVRVEDPEGGATVITLVYPHEANVGEGKVSVLAPMGMALIGLRAGQRYSWPMPDGRIKKFLVAAVGEE
jgi:regulator of nucleoside diphosphate kinase